MALFHDSAIAGASGQAVGGAYKIERSLRFNSSDSAYLSRTPASAGNRKTWTWSGWVKRSSGAVYQKLFSAGTSNGERTEIGLEDNDSLIFLWATSGAPGGGFPGVRSSALFRDYSAWYHIVVSIDTTQTTAANRCKLYVNGQSIANFSVELYPTQNYDTYINSTSAHSIARSAPQAAEYYNGYLADVHFIDGQALDPTSFAETNTSTGQWVPKAYTGTYGTNGFRLAFADNSNNTATTLGKDTSGNGNNWTPNNLSSVSGGPTSVAAASGALPIYNTTDTYGTTKGTGTRTDSNSSSISLALPMDGANNGTTFTDESAAIKGSGSAKTITRYNAVTSTSQSKYYGSSGYFDGTGDYLTVGSSADFAFGTGVFTVEFWMYASNVTSRQALVAAGGGSGASPVIAIYGQGGVVGALDLGVYGVSNNVISSANSIRTNTWHHVAFVREGTGTNQTKVYVDGVHRGQGTYSTNVSTNIDFYIGQNGTNGEYFTGYLQDVRIYKGVAKYTSNFNPPNSTQNPTIAAGFDSTVDTPTSYGIDTGAGGEVRGNYATLNAVAPALTNLSYANGNLEAVKAAGTNDSPAITTLGVLSGKWYWEVVWTSFAVAAIVGITDGTRFATALGAVYHQGRGYINDNGDKVSSSTTNPVASRSSYGSTWTANDVIGVALDADAGSVTFYKNGVSQGVAFSSLGWSSYFPQVFLIGASNAGTAVCNFGQRPFAYTAPSGFKALCDTNLPAPVVAKPSEVIDVVTYTGITQSPRTITGLSFEPDFVWVKNRSISSGHYLWDAVRGTDANLRSDGTFDEAAVSAASNGIISTNASNGFVVKNGATSGTNVGSSGSDAYVAWAWDAGSSTVTNTQGSITSQVRANASAGFSIVTYTGNGVSGATVGHGLGVAPSLIIQKERSQGTGGWNVYHSSLGATQYLQINLTDAATASANQWNNTAPTSTVFSLGSSGEVNDNGQTNVAYCFAPVAGYSAFGSYTGNGSADGPFVFLGFRPAVVIVKMSSSTGNWTILDYQREGYNVDNDPLFPNLSNAEGTTDLIDLTSNGFKVRTTDATFNTNAGTYVYAAWAQNPYQYARAR